MCQVPYDEPRENAARCGLIRSAKTDFYNGLLGVRASPVLVYAHMFWWAVGLACRFRLQIPESLTRCNWPSIAAIRPEGGTTAQPRATPWVQVTPQSRSPERATQHIMFLPDAPFQGY
jgi:hypothetical protein